MNDSQMGNNGSTGETTRQKVCPKCGTPVKEGQMFCANCGARIEVKQMFCSNCGAQIEAGQTFCPNCGYRIDGGSTQPDRTGGKPHKKRKIPIIISIILVVIMFASVLIFYLAKSVKSIDLSEDELEIKVDEISILEFDISPSDAINKNVTWSSSDTSVAEVNNSGIVKGINEGTCTITITTDNGKTDICNVTVIPRGPERGKLQTQTVVCGEDYTVAVRTDGSIIFTGFMPVGFPAGLIDTDTPGVFRTRTDTDIISLTRDERGRFLAGLCSDGTVVVPYSYFDDVQDWTDVVDVAIGGEHIVGLRSDGTVVAAGDNEYGQCDVSGWTDIVAISAGFYYTVGLRSDGTVVAVGDNEYGQCDVSDWTDIAAVYAKDGTTLGLRSDGTLALNVPDFEDADDPLFTTMLNEMSGWTDIVALFQWGDIPPIGLRSDGTLALPIDPNGAYDFEIDYEFGEGFVDFLKELSGWTDIVALTTSAGDNLVVVGLRSDGTVVAAGDNEYGQCDVSGWTDIVAVAAGYNHTVGLRSDGTVVAVGDNERGQCNVSDWSDIKLPDEVNMKTPSGEGDATSKSESSSVESETEAPESSPVESDTEMPETSSAEQEPEPVTEEAKATSRPSRTERMEQKRKAVLEQIRKNKKSNSESSDPLTRLAEICGTSALCQTDESYCVVYPFDENEHNPYDVEWDYGEDYAELVSQCDWSLVFDIEYYKKTFPALAYQYHDNDALLLEHFQTVGVHEGRQGSESFNAAAYRENCSEELRTAFGDEWACYYIYYMLHQDTESSVTVTGDFPKQMTAELTYTQEEDFRAVNRFREQEGLDPYVFDSETAAIASNRAYIDATEHWLRHDYMTDGSNGDARTNQYCAFVKEVHTYGENKLTAMVKKDMIEYQTTTAIVPAIELSDSKPHYEAMVSTEYEYFGDSSAMFVSDTHFSTIYDDPGEDTTNKIDALYYQVFFTDVHTALNK